LFINFKFVLSASDLADYMLAFVRYVL